MKGVTKNLTDFTSLKFETPLWYTKPTKKVKDDLRKFYHKKVTQK